MEAPIYSSVAQQQGNISLSFTLETGFKIFCLAFKGFTQPAGSFPSPVPAAPLRSNGNQSVNLSNKFVLLHVLSDIKFLIL